ncbi:hypothetical protein BASA61_006429 [Batrachochytrium salamandrivorans]|nr:hypothetical protein BASA61_006429 [Batrachochytrium salamandrivorans]
MEERNYVEMGLSILKENIERQPDPDPNDESQDLMGASYDSNLPREILAEQIGEFFQDSADLSAIDGDLDVGIHKFDDVIKRTKDSKKKLELIETKNKLMRPSNQLYDEVKFTQLKWTYSKELQAEFGWKPKSSRVSKVFKSSRKGHKMN